MISYKQFVSQCKNLVENELLNHVCTNDMNTYDSVHFDNDKNWYVYVEWISGGASGGNCWNSNAPTEFGSDVEVEFKFIKKYLIKYYHDILYCDAIGINSLIQTCTRTEREYYSNYTMYTMKYISLKAMYNYLKGINKV